MDSENNNEKRPLNPRQNANIFSKITFWYTVDLFKKGFKRELDEEDLYEVLPEFESCSLGDQIEHEWEQQKHRKNALFVVFLKLFAPYYCILCLNMVFHITFHVVQPMIISKLVFLFAPGRKELNTFNIYSYSALLIILLLLDIVCRQNFFFLTENLVIKIRTAICTLVYRKLLRLPARRLRHISFGSITNLVTRDINAFDRFFIAFSYGWTGFIITIITCCNMYQNIGFPTIIVIVVVAVLTPIQVLIGIWIASLKKASCKKTDNRIAILQEVLSNMRSTKMYVWEQYFENRMTNSRKEETDLFVKVIFLLFSSVALGIAVADLTFYTVLMMYIWYGQQLSSEIIYFIIGGFINLNFNFSAATPYSTFSFAQVIAATQRMQIIIKQLEMDYKPTKSCETNYPRIKMKNVTVAEEDKVILKNVSFDVEEGLTLVTGNASSGKSVLLMTLLKEFEISQGDVVVEGSISYASQEPWLFPSTIRQNILFGSNYEHKRYQDVIKACDLQYDFDLMEKGDSTVVADRGINLSKGQQSRINLARATYKKSDIYLLDDCLSSLDPLVARFIFTNCILKFLSNKIVLLVSYNTNLFPYAGKILKLYSGHTVLCKNDCPQQADESMETAVPKVKVCSDEIKTEDDGCSDKKKLVTTNKIKPIYSENKKVGAVSPQVYQTFINLGGGAFFCLIIFCLFLLAQLSISYKFYLIRNWANFEDKILEVNGSRANDSNYSNLMEERNDVKLKFTAVVIVISVITLIRAVALFLFCKTVSINLHNTMLSNVLTAFLSFFDDTFIGNIINRFSKDLVTIDETIPIPLYHMTSIIFETAGTLVIIASTNLELLIPIALLFAVFALLRYIYLKTGRPLKRLDASTKSPVIGYFSVTLEGLLSIKVFRAENILKKELEKHHNLYNSATFLHFACLKALVFAADLCVLIFVAIVIFQFVIFNHGVSPADFGLALSQALIMGSMIYFAVYNGVELEIQMTSVERAIEYTTIKNEKKSGLEPIDFPKAGEIKYENVSLSLDKSKTYLLKNINFFIIPQEKIGIVGRTGAGKSSIISALFRLYDFEGKITIDGIDITTLSLSFLRSRISVIPQDPILFDGTLRDNIDPGGKHKDQEIWNALDIVKLKNSIKILDINIRELNLTCGQKQLISLARILMSNNKILLIDEMVESVDFETEHLIYDVINRCFASYTIIKVAHRLKFVLDCDKVMVVENGEIVECGSPSALLQNRVGLFYKMEQNSTVDTVSVF